MAKIIGDGFALKVLANTWTQLQTMASALITTLTATTANITNLTWNGSAVSGLSVQRAMATYTANASITTIIPIDDTIPQVGEGTEILSVSVTPKKTGNILRARYNCFAGISDSGNIISALFVNGEANAVQAVSNYSATVNAQLPMSMEYEMTAASTAPVTFSVRVGIDNAVSFRMNGSSASRIFGGAAAATLVIEEIAL